MTPALDRFVRDNLAAALQRINDDVVTINVYMRDANGPRGGVDKQVLICVRLRNRQLVAVQTTHEDMYAAIKTGIKRTKRALRRHIRKSNHFEKHSVRRLLNDPGVVTVPKP